jgi:hypothetical protein
MAKLGDRISTLEEKLKELKAKQAAIDARRRAVESRRQRRDEVRRKILVGAIVLESVGKGELDKAPLWRLLDKALTRREDRELFEGLGGDGEKDGGAE